MPPSHQRRSDPSRPTSTNPRSVAAQTGRLLRRWVLAAGRALFAPRKLNRSRRDLLHGRIWRFVPASRFPPLVTRYPKPLPPDQRPPRAEPRNIGGINIDPVPATDLKRQPSPPTVPVFRPPGAIAEPQFMAGCTRCGDCITACPHDAIVTAAERLGAVAGTPIIEADTAACAMCEDFPCITACEPGVLSPSVAPIMGTAQVTPHLCLAHHNTLCTVCSERCPVAGAITLADGKPTVNEDVCTGCGMCRYVCPAPENAILLMPALTRPGLPHQ